MLDLSLAYNNILHFFYRSLQLVVFLDEFDKLYSANPAICDEFLEAICTIKHGLYGKTIIHAMVAIGTIAIPSCGYV